MDCDAQFRINVYITTRLVGKNISDKGDYVKAHECIDPILELRSLSKTFNNYLLGTLQVLKPDNLLHPE